MVSSTLTRTGPARSSQSALRTPPLTPSCRHSSRLGCTTSLRLVSEQFRFRPGRNYDDPFMFMIGCVRPLTRPSRVASGIRTVGIAWLRLGQDDAAVERQDVELDCESVAGFVRPYGPDVGPEGLLSAPTFLDRTGLKVWLLAHSLSFQCLQPHRIARLRGLTDQSEQAAVSSLRPAHRHRRQAAQGGPARKRRHLKRARSGVVLHDGKLLSHCA
jgi:hypothetical protein